MSRVQSKNTRPEIVVRQTSYRLGYRYRLHCPDLPGKPDIVFKSRKKVIFVNGCFWHRHQGCNKTRTPKSNVDFWNNKFQKTVERDQATCADLMREGWDVLIVWECEIRNIQDLKTKMIAFLGE